MDYLEFSKNQRLDDFFAANFNPIQIKRPIGMQDSIMRNKLNNQLFSDQIQMSKSQRKVKKSEPAV